jgi:hypothetical protein
MSSSAIPGGDDEHRGGPRFAVLIEEFEAVHSRQVYIQDDKIRRPDADYFQSILGALHGTDLQALLGEVERNQIGQLPHILHDKDFRFHRVNLTNRSISAARVLLQRRDRPAAAGITKNYNPLIRR